ncbi:MAG TPA: right-handed parallel beta-helix repeat-containing protein [Xanthobacteraceae bacterium]|nr:right-handed parallel beta-helix repeat-containing protein [Xanthobacteraceae bacterium]
MTRSIAIVALSATAALPSARGGAGNAAAGRSVTLYVSAAAGNDGWSGRLAAPNSDATDGPLASLDGARRAVRAIDKRDLDRVTVLLRDGTSRVRLAELGGLPQLADFDGGGPGRPFREGVYRLSQPVELGPEDSGSERTEIAYQNYPGEFPVISGGVRVLNWQHVGGNKWQTTLPKSTQNFENLFYNGERRLRPRLGGYLGPYGRIWMTVHDASGGANCPANDDNSECFDRFQYNADPNAPYNTGLQPETWGNLVPAPGSPCNQHVDRSDQPLWGDIEVLVFEQFSTSKLRVRCVDTANQIVYMTGPTAVPGSDNASEAGFITGNRFIVENVKSALTEPGQWFLDRSAVPWTLTYLARTGENPNVDEVIIPQASQLVVAHDVRHVTLRGLTFEHDNYTIAPTGHVSTELEPDLTSAISFQNSRDVTADGIVVRHTAGGGLDFISCLQKEDQQGDTVSPAWCRVFDPNAVTARNLIENSAFYDLGAHGIRIGENNNTDLDALTNDANVPQFFVVQNNVVSGYGRVIPAAFGIGQGVGHDNLYVHNDVYDGYHCAISISEGGGDNFVPNGKGNADNTIAFNHVHDLLQGIMNDGGSIRIEAGNATHTAPGNRILNNKIHDTSDASALDTPDITLHGVNVRPGYGGDGIYMDNSTGLVDVENNLVYRVSGNAIYTPHGPQQASPPAPWGLGQSNLIKNNILAYARHGMVTVNDPYYAQSKAPFTASPVFLFTNNLLYFDRDDTLTPSFTVQSDCTFSANLEYRQFELLERNQYWRTDGKFAADMDAFHIQPKAVAGGPCSKQSTDWAFFYFDHHPPGFLSWQRDQHEDIGSLVRDPHFANPAFPADDYSLPYGSPNPFFVPFDANLAGRSRSHFAFTPPPIAPTFVTAPFDPATDF